MLEGDFAVTKISCFFIVNNIGAKIAFFVEISDAK